MRATFAATLLIAIGLCGDPQAQPSQATFDPVATFSILGYDPDTGEVGGAVQSRVFSVGNGVLWGEANVGMAATQAIVDVSYGPQALASLRAGVTPSAIIKAIWDSDPDPGLNGRDWTKQGRQFAVMDAKGNYAAFTGPKATSWAGQAALDGGQAAGGDTRGMPSAAMLIVKKDGGVWLHNDVVLRLQVDDSPEPLKELRRLVEMNARRFRPR